MSEKSKMKALVRCLDSDDHHRICVGVGSLWRFPLCLRNQWRALFILTYILVIIVIGIPLLTAEISMGYVTQKTAIGAYQTLKPHTKWHYAAYLHVFVGIMVNAYTVPIYIWILVYIWRTATGFFEGMDAEGIATSFDELNVDYATMFLFGVINWAIMIVIISRGIQSGVEKANKFLLPALAVIMIVCIVIGLQVEGSAAGIEYMFNPNTENFSFNSLTAAVGQAFFAIGIGMLASMVFGSYIKEKNARIVKQSSIICSSIPVCGSGFQFDDLPDGICFRSGTECRRRSDDGYSAERIQLHRRRKNHRNAVLYRILFRRTVLVHRTGGSGHCRSHGYVWI